MPRYSIHTNDPVLPYAKNAYRNAHAAMPMSRMRFTPSRTSKIGSSSMKPSSDICPKLILLAGSGSPISFK